MLKARLPAEEGTVLVRALEAARDRVHERRRARPRSQADAAAEAREPVHLAAHHRRHWAHGGETSLDNLSLLCWQHHRLVHEGGYTIEPDPEQGVRFRNRHGIVIPNPPRPPPGSADELGEGNRRAGLTITEKTNRNGTAERMDLASPSTR